MKDQIGSDKNKYLRWLVTCNRSHAHSAPLRRRYFLCGVEIARIIRKIGLLPDALYFIPIDSRNSCLFSNRTFNFNAKTKNNIPVQFIDVSIGRYDFAETRHVLRKVSIINDYNLEQDSQMLSPIDLRVTKSR